MNLRNIFSELRRRNVYRAAAAYGVVVRPRVAMR